MDDPAFSATTQPAPLARLDPQIEEFTRRMGADAAQYPRRDTVSIAKGREIAEKVRAPWARGGPTMARTVERTVPTRHGEVRLRVYTPASRSLPGALLYIHGGGFVLFSLDTHDRVMREYAERAGITVVGIDYTRAPDAKFPQPLEECIDVVAWLAAHGRQLDIDPTQLFIGGDSAGGNLSLATCIDFRDRGLAPIAGMVLNYGAFNTDVHRNSMLRYGAGEYGLSLHMMVWFYRNYLRGRDDYADPRVNLVAAQLHGLPPALMAITECDPLHDDSIEMGQLLRQAGVDVTDKVYPGTVHSFLEAVSVADVAAEAFDDAARWIRRIAQT